MKHYWYAWSHWLVERWDYLWNVRTNKPAGKLNDKHWIDNSEWDK